MKKLSSIFICTLLTQVAFCQEVFPVLGHVGLRSANIMIHGNSNTNEVTISIMDSLNQTIQLKKESVNHLVGHTCVFEFSQLMPNTKYSYIITTGDYKSRKYAFQTQQLWQWREDPPNFQFAFGSCTYVNDPPFDRPGKGYGQPSTIFNSILLDNPIAMIWGGDNIYFREGDWETASDMSARYTHTRSDENINKLLHEIPNYAVWDDHDFGPNDSNSSFQFKKESAQVFRQMWPNQGYVNSSGAVYGKSSIHDIEFYFLDNRYYRTAHLKNISSQMLGKEQIDWLITGLVSSKASFKFIVVGSQILNTEAVFETYANHSSEREYLLKQLEIHQIKNVVFLSGDRHFSECSVLNLNSPNRIIDLTSSPLTSKPFSDVKESNGNRINGSIVTEQNYALIHLTGPLKNRQLLLELKNQNGKVLWSQTFNSN